MSSWIRIPCRHAHRLMSERRDRPLGWVERWRLRLHLAICDSCTRIDRQLTQLGAAIRRLGS